MYDSDHFKTIGTSIVPRLVALFPNLVALSVSGCDQTVLQSFISFIRNFTCLKVKNVSLAKPLHPIELKLTRLEFCYIVQGFEYLSTLLNAATTLEYIKLSRVRSLPPMKFSLPSYSDTIHSFSHHAHFKGVGGVALRAKRIYLFGNSLVAPHVGLKFDREVFYAMRWLDYEVQFPVLETIRISWHEKCGVQSAEDKLTEREFF